MSGYVSVVLVDPSLSHLGRSFTYSVPDGMDVARGALVRVPFHRKRRSGVVVAHMDAPDVARTLPVHAVAGPGLPGDLVDLALWTADRYCASEGEALAAALPQRIVSEEKIPPDRVPYPVRTARVLPGYRNGEQLARAVEDGSGGGFVWRPRTDDARGETAVALVDRTLQRGGGALVLLPEVRFGSEVADALKAAFGDGVAWLGSDRPARARYRDWLALRAGAKRIAVGGRGAVFAPVADLGLVMIDDEGHASYKEGRAPRFHARTIAAERARRAGAVIVLTGVPPSIDARAAVQRGPFVSVVPDRSAERSVRPPVSVIDLSKEDSSLVPSARPIASVRAELAAGRRVMVLAHRGGPDADALAERVFRILKAARPVRLDATATLSSLRRAARGADVIVTTPFLAKDLPAEPVGLLAVVQADAALSQPEFRAHEDTFATWWRAARWAAGGRIVIESADPTQAPIAALTRWDPEVLWRAEAARRRELGYPPFAVMARIDTPSERAGDVVDALKGATGIEVLGPIEREGRTVVVARAARREVLLSALRPIATAWRADEEPMRIDVDPWEVFVPKWRS
ncbi:MAG TPA: hypothetical protein VM600_05500 [Actinomycetota bacterium]|nr:hypothetical protein [Actinomycetota bacterium]